MYKVKGGLFLQINSLMLIVCIVYYNCQFQLEGFIAELIDRITAGTESTYALTYNPRTFTKIYAFTICPGPCKLSHKPSYQTLQLRL